MGVKRGWCWLQVLWLDKGNQGEMHYVHISACIMEEGFSVVKVISERYVPLTVRGTGFMKNLCYLGVLKIPIRRIDNGTLDEVLGNI